MGHQKACRGEAQNQSNVYYREDESVKGWKEENHLKKKNKSREEEHVLSVQSKEVKGVLLLLNNVN